MGRNRNSNYPRWKWEYLVQLFQSENNKIVADNEPNKTDWDIVFTQYLDSRQRNYLVFGVLQGPSISVAKKTDENKP